MVAPDPLCPANALIEAVAARDEDAFAAVTADDVTLRVWRWDGHEVYRVRDRVWRQLVDEWDGWRTASNPELTIENRLPGAARSAVEFSVRALDSRGVPALHARSLFATARDRGTDAAGSANAADTADADPIQHLDLYCAAPTPCRLTSAMLESMAPDEQLDAIIATHRFTRDARMGVPAPSASRSDAALGYITFFETHPHGNTVRYARLSDADADARIEQLIAEHARDERAFTWLVNPAATPADLAARLERHGFALAGHVWHMVRRDLDDVSDIPADPDVEIEIIAPDDTGRIDRALDIVAEAFQLPAGRADSMRLYWRERARFHSARGGSLYLAGRGGERVAMAELNGWGAIASLEGAATLSAHRGQGLYATLLRRRLTDARDRGYHLAWVEAQPSSRRLLSRFGFADHARMSLYAWMPVPDQSVIDSLIQRE